ncbi:MAG: dephospho-CoA kinase [Cyanobacteria bacterium P01_F01_bin.42]
MSNLSLRTIGITGGIACGKSTVCDYLSQKHDCLILDADVLARSVVSPLSPVLESIHSRYGTDILTSAGELNRQRLGEIIFHDADERRWLESMIHPEVRRNLIEGRDRYWTTHSQPSQPLIMSIPLLFESGMEDLVTEVWVITCTPTQQRNRLIARNRLSISDAAARIQSQWPLSAKIKRASLVIDNSRTRQDVYQQVDVALRAPG